MGPRKLNAWGRAGAAVAVALVLLALAGRPLLDGLRRLLGSDSEPVPQWSKLYNQPRPRQLLSTTDTLTAQQLAALGYATGVEEAGDVTGVRIHDPERVQPGLNLYSSGHDNAAFLIDREGRLRHRWRIEPETLWPKRSDRSGHYFRRVRLLPGGDLLVIQDGLGIARLDRDSNVRWRRVNAAHHDVSVGSDGRIYVLTRKAHVVPRVDPEVPILEDFVTVLDGAGRTLRTVSILEAFERSPFAPLVRASLTSQDPFHTNTVKILEAPDMPEPFRAGRVLVSMREMDTVAVLDLERGEIVWALTGLWHRQHEPTLLDNGNLLVFDNRGVRHAGQEYSRVIELDPATQQVVWAYEGDPSNGFYSEGCGASQRLANGNTLVTETDAGRAFEVAPDGRIVWEFLSPHRPEGRPDIVASLFELSRVPADQPWLDR